MNQSNFSVLIGQSILNELIKSIDEYRNLILGVQHSILNNISIISVQKYLNLDIIKEIDKSITEFKNHFDSLPEKIKPALIELADNGWYFDIDLDFEDLFQSKIAINNGEITSIDKSYSDYIEGQLESIESNIIGKFPNRKNIIIKSFEAHKNGNYELSIPVFLIQVDGICKERMSGYFFRSINKKPQTYEYVEKKEDSEFIKSFLSVLTEYTPINIPESKRDPNHGKLNGHEILHGDSIDYPSKINSLKTISLLNYVVKVLYLKE